MIWFDLICDLPITGGVAWSCRPHHASAHDPEAVWRRTMHTLITNQKRENNRRNGLGLPVLIRSNYIYHMLKIIIVIRPTSLWIITLNTRAHTYITHTIYQLYHYAYKSIYTIIIISIIIISSLSYNINYRQLIAKTTGRQEKYLCTRPEAGSATSVTLPR